MNEIALVRSNPAGLYQLAIGIAEDQIHPELSELTKEQLALLKIDSKPKSCAIIGRDHGSLIALGIGDRSKLKDFGAAAVRAATSGEHLVFDLRGFTAQEVQDVALGSLIGGKTNSSYRKKNDSPSRVSLLVDSDLQVDLKPTQIIAKEILHVRELINTPANDLWPAKLAELVEQHLYPLCYLQYGYPHLSYL